MSTEISQDRSGLWFETPDPARPPLALIAGPTASGKSDCAVALAQAIEARGQGTVIVNADSAQVYADLQLLSARPSHDDMGGIAHRLFGTWDGALACSAADWASAARTEIDAAHGRNEVPILVGGTGLYLRTLLEGIAPIPAIDEAIRAHVRALPVAEAYRALCQEDPGRAAMLHSGDTIRIARALEVVRSTGVPLTAWQARREGGLGHRVDLQAAILLPDRAALYRRCDARFAKMVQSGAVEEVARLLARDLDPSLPVMRAIGVPELASYLQGARTLADAIDLGAQATRRYAKRQYTWFRHQPPSGWQRIDTVNKDARCLSAIILHHYGLT